MIRMENLLIAKLHDYMVANNPDLLVQLQETGSVTTYLLEKAGLAVALAEQLISAGTPLYDIEASCLDEMTRDLRPSRYVMIKELLEEEFPDAYTKLADAGVLTYEVINMLGACREIFETTGFTEENEDDRWLRYALTGAISGYLQGS